jgi:HEAT repeat protein
MPISDIPVEILLQELHGSDWETRCHAARLLGQSGDPRAVDALLPDLNDPALKASSSLTRSAAALTLSWYPEETVRTTATWAPRALQKVFYYRNQLGS